MLGTAVQTNSEQINQVASSNIGAGSGVPKSSPLGKAFASGSLDNPNKAGDLAKSILKANDQAPFLSEAEVEQLRSVVDNLDSGSIGDQLMALDRLVDTLIEIHPGGTKGSGLSLADLKALDAQVSPLADSYRSVLESALNQESPAEQLGALQDFSNQLQSADAGYAAKLGLAGPEAQSFLSSSADLIDSYKSILSTESAKLVGDNASWESFVGSVKELKTSMEVMGLNVEGSAVDNFLSAYGSSESLQEIGKLDMFEQRSMVVSFRTELLNELGGTDMASTLLPQGVETTQQQLKVEEDIFAVGDFLTEDQFRGYLSDAKSTLIGADGSLAGASAEDFQSYKSNLTSIIERRCAELKKDLGGIDIPVDPALRTAAQQAIVDGDVVLSMVDGSMAWANKWEEEAGSGLLTKNEALSAGYDLVLMDAAIFKHMQVWVADAYGTDSEIYAIVTEWYEVANEMLFKIRDVLKMAANS